MIVSGGLATSYLSGFNLASSLVEYAEIMGHPGRILASIVTKGNVGAGVLTKGGVNPTVLSKGSITTSVIV